MDSGVTDYAFCSLKWVGVLRWGGGMLCMVTVMVVRLCVRVGGGVSRMVGVIGVSVAGDGCRC